MRGHNGLLRRQRLAGFTRFLGLSRLGRGELEKSHAVFMPQCPQFAVECKGSPRYRGGQRRGTYEVIQLCGSLFGIGARRLRQNGWLIHSPDGKLTGRIQSDFIDTDGKVAEKSAAADGAISGNDLVLKPASAWYGGVQASGTIKGS
ncbi:hypothetical protein E4T56_gene4273, partial [Termitomyces sp. T112]